MIEEAEARERILERVAPLGVEGVPLEDALGRVAGADVLATQAMPAFDQSAMDGYAVRHVDAVEGASLEVVGESAAGGDLPQRAVEAGQAWRIFTGAPIPPGATAVVMQEDVDVVEATPRGGAVRIVVRAAAEEGEFIRRRGGDIAVGQRLVRAGERLDARRIGLLATQGAAIASCGIRPQVSVVTTGDELVPVGAPLPEGRIHDSNGPMLGALVREAGAILASARHVPDDLERTRIVLGEAVDEADVVVVAGGVSVGDRDHVKGALEALGVELGFWRVRVKPGKPFVFGIARSGTLVFGLPGNPVSSFVTFVLFVRPALLRLMGAASGAVDATVGLRTWVAPAGAELSNPGDRPQYARVVVDPVDGRVRPAGIQESHALRTLARADGLVRLEAGQVVAAGEPLRVLLL